MLEFTFNGNKFNQVKMSNSHVFLCPLYQPLRIKFCKTIANTKIVLCICAYIFDES